MEKNIQLSQEDRINVLKANGWYQYYSKTHWVHADIFKYMEKMKRMYFGNDHTNYQYTVDEAYEVNKEM